MHDRKLFQMLLTCVSLLAAAATGGCNILAWPMYVLAGPPPTRTVRPEYDKLRNATVGVFVFAGPGIQLDYETAQFELAGAVGVEMRDHLKKVKVVDPRRVLRYQHEHPSWDAVPSWKLARDLRSDFVLIISLMEFSTRQPGSIHLAQGRISAEVTLYKPGDPDAGDVPVWRAGLIRVTFPEKSPLGVPADDDRRVRIATERIFADRLVKKFYKHEVPVRP